MRDHLRPFWLARDIDYHVAYISLWETGKSEPPLLVLLDYAKCIGVWVDVLINDALDLPPIKPISPPAQLKRQKSRKPQKRQKRRTFVRHR